MTRGLLLSTLCILAAVGPCCGQSQHGNSALAASMERKLRHIERNGALPHPDPAPTQIGENEVNAYLASGRVALPDGVKSVRFQGHPEIITAETEIDFDRLKGGKDSFNPLLAIFTGIHDLTVIAHAHAAGGQATVHVDSVSLDGVDIPRFALELFVEKYIKPQYPDAGLDSHLQLANRIDSAYVGERKLTISQR